MTDTSPDDVARLVDAVRAGDRAALDALAPLLYDELRRVARGYMRRERHAQTMQPTALVHEAWARLMGAHRLAAQNRAHLMAIAAHVMRQILVERARARRAAKRGADPERVTFDENAGPPAPGAAYDVEALDAALSRLAAIDPEGARIVELRFFGGLTIEETAEQLAVSPATVKRRWTLAKAWLVRELER